MSRGRGLLRLLRFRWLAQLGPSRPRQLHPRRRAAILRHSGGTRPHDSCGPRQRVCRAACVLISTVRCCTQSRLVDRILSDPPPIDQVSSPWSTLWKRCHGRRSRSDPLDAPDDDETGGGGPHPFLWRLTVRRFATPYPTPDQPERLPVSVHKESSPRSPDDAGAAVPVRRRVRTMRHIGRPPRHRPAVIRRDCWLGSHHGMILLLKQAPPSDQSSGSTPIAPKPPRSQAHYLSRRRPGSDQGRPDASSNPA